MNAGKLNTRMTWRRIVATNNAGDVVTSHEDKEIQVGVLGNGGRKGEDNHETFTSNSIRFVMRNQYAIEESDQVVYKGNVYAIDNLDDASKPGWLFVSMSKTNN